MGASMSDTTAAAAPYDLRYLYISGGFPDGTGPCASCASGCATNGQSCANSAGGCGWWGCWQWDHDPPGKYASGFVGTAQGDHQIPMFTYYEILQASGVNEGPDEVNIAANDTAFMTRYFNDWRFLLQQIGSNQAFLHIEPDFWGYAGQINLDPTQITASVASANPTDCASSPNTIAGLGQCMIHMVRIYAPNALVGLHGSAWGTNMDVLGNTDPNFDVVGEANKLGDFLRAAGADTGDFVVVDASDRDAAWYTTQGRNTWWDATNATLPNFTQAFNWASAVASRVGKPIVWWQVPVGNMSLPNTHQEWQDNRVDYFFDHPDQLVASKAFAAAFGAGDSEQTTPDTDNGHLSSRVTTYETGGGQALCP
ncbi:MAG: hypothetical protein JST54_27500 [Deltaproteobacteria bacterium]|nr:hypothetical protein [Deltaproteobacteria bacterium]